MMMNFNFILLGLFVAGATAAPIDTTSLPSVPVGTAMGLVNSVTAPIATATSVSLPHRERRVLDFDSIRAPKPTDAARVPSDGNASQRFAATVPAGGAALGSLTNSVPVSLPTNANIPNRRDDTASAIGDECDEEADPTLRERALVPNPHTTISFNSIKIRHNALPTAAANVNVAGAGPKVAGTANAQITAA